MGKLSSSPFFVAVVLLALTASCGLGVNAQDAAAIGAAPPMYAAHDFASEKLQERRTLPDGSACDAEFGTALEGIVNDMEENKEGTQELADSLKTKFKELMDQNPSKNLCSRGSWCDDSVCKKRTKMQGRSFNGAAAGSDSAGGDTPKPVPTATQSSNNAAEVTAIVSLILTMTIAVILQ